MARELRRLLIAPERLAPEVALTREEERYLTRVLRFGSGDRFAVINGQGALWTAVLQEDGSAQLEQDLNAPLELHQQPAPSLVLAAAVVKRDFELVVRMAVELGGGSLHPAALRANGGSREPARRALAQHCRRGG